MYKRSATVIKHVNMTIKLIFERYKAIKNISMLRNLVLKLSIFLQNHILINLVLKLSNNYIRTNIIILRFILILERYKMIKSISEEDKSGPKIIEFSPILQYITISRNLVLKLSNFLPYHNISHYFESEYYIHSYFIHRILKYLHILLVSISMYTRICGILM